MILEEHCFPSESDATLDLAFLFGDQWEVKVFESLCCVFFVCVKTKVLVLHRRKLHGIEKRARRGKFGHCGLGCTLGRRVIISGERRWRERW